MITITPERYNGGAAQDAGRIECTPERVAQEQARRLTDGPGGWSVVETMCHIRDFADVSLRRAQLILEETSRCCPTSTRWKALSAGTMRTRNWRRNLLPIWARGKL